MSVDGASVSTTTGDDEPTDSELARALESYLAAVEAGQPVDLERLAAEHPKIAEQLRSCLGVLRLAGRVEGNADANSSSGHDDRLAPDMLLGDFRMLRPIGRGGMGIVYEAEQVSLHRRVALKILPFAAALDPHQLQRFQTEAQAAAQLHHTNIVPVFSVGCERGVYYYAMQFIEGQTVAALIRDLQRLPGLEAEPGGAPAATGSLAEQVVSGRLAPVSAPPSPPASESSPTPQHAAAAPLSNSSTRSRAFIRTVAHLGVQAAEALDYAHRMGIVHRDIKPANLLVDVRGNLWVTDFGLARMRADTGLTMTGDVLGTLRYMSPEQALARRGVVDHRTDIYSLGATLYELLTLRPAFAGQDRQELLRQLTLDEPRPLRRYNPQMPADVETIVLKAMSKEPESRYGTAQEMADDLRRFLELKPIKARRPTLPERATKWARRHTIGVAAAAVVLCLSVIGLTVGLVLVDRERTEALRQRKQAEENFRLARDAVDQMLTEVGQSTLARVPQAERTRKALLEKAVTFYHAFLERQGNDPSLRLQTAQAYERVGDINKLLGRHAAAESAYRRSVALLDAPGAGRLKEPEARLALAVSLRKLGPLLADLGRRGEAESSLSRSIQLLSALSDSQASRELAASYSNLGNLAWSLQRFPDAAAAFDRARAILEPLIAGSPGAAEDQSRLAATLNGLALVAISQGRFEEARDLLERAVARQSAARRADPDHAQYREFLSSGFAFFTRGE